MEKVNVLHLVNNLADLSIIRIVEQIVRLSGSDGYCWYIGSLHGAGEMTDPLINLGARILTYPANDPIAKLQKDIKGHFIHIIHSHTPRTTLTAYRAIRRLPYDLKPKHIATKHLLTRPSDRKFGLIYAMVDYLSLYLADRLVPVSFTMGNQLLKLPYLTKHKIYPIPNGIQVEQYQDDQARYIARKEFGLSENITLLGYAGRLDAVKRIDLLLEAFKSVYQSYPNCRLLILGDGQMTSQLQALSSMLGLARVVIWAGFRQDMSRMFSAMDVYIQPSDNEGLSLSILEAMAARRPVISTKVGAAKEVLVHGQTGWLIDPRSIDQLTNAMKYAISRPDFFSKMADLAYQQVQKKYSVSSMVNSYQKLYSSLHGEIHHG